MNHVKIPHVMSAQKPFDEVFNVGGKEGKPIGGDVDTPNVMNIYDQNFNAAVYRQIIDLGNLENSYFIYPTGQSGHLASPHYSDMFEKWRTGKYVKMLWTDEQIENDRESELILTPAS